MPPAQQANLQAIAREFDIPGRFVSAQPHGGGHINDTFLSIFEIESGLKRFIHQRINHQVFKEPWMVMENIERVTLFARERITAAGGDPERETLNLVPARDGRTYIVTPEGDTWRTYRYIDGARTYELPENDRMVYNAARAFGRFQTLLGSLPGERLHETIPNFHHTRKRFEAFLQALKADPANRAAQVKPEINFILSREKDASVVVDLLGQGKIPERATHNDTKLNNVMIDAHSGEGICVIDLDTMMPGSALYDFGDLIRMGAATAAEDEPDLGKVGVDLRLFEQLTRGYLSAAGGFLTPTEIDYLAFAGRLITYEQAIRFLGDYLNGDTYYKIHRPGHNLDRARTQIQMITEMERQQGEMERTIYKCL